MLHKHFMLSKASKTTTTVLTKSFLQPRHLKQAHFFLRRLQYFLFAGSGGNSIRKISPGFLLWQWRPRWFTGSRSDSKANTSKPLNYHNLDMFPFRMRHRCLVSSKEANPITCPLCQKGHPSYFAYMDHLQSSPCGVRHQSPAIFQPPRPFW